MKELSNKIKFPSELRFGLGSGDWVVIATGRAKRPETFKQEKRSSQAVPKSQCPFCQIVSQAPLDASPRSSEGKGQRRQAAFALVSNNKHKAPFELLKGQENPILVFSQGKKIEPGKGIGESWTTLVVPNKFPAFTPSLKLNKRREGPFYQILDAVGFHEVVVTRDHKKHMAQFSIAEVKEVFDVYQERYRALKKEKFVNHISIFHNHGREAGASVAHPHSQIITTPLVDTDLKKALSNSRQYFKKHKACLYCRMNDWEKISKKRIVFENEGFLVLCPFASKSAFEVIVSPKKHLAYFEEISEKEKWQLAEAFKTALAKLDKALNDPAYNFYLHTSPCDGKEYPYYHWHWTILPKTSIWAGFEIGTRMEISTIEPEKAADYLRRQ